MSSSRFVSFQGYIVSQISVTKVIPYRNYKYSMNSTLALHVSTRSTQLSGVRYIELLNKLESVA